MSQKGAKELHANCLICMTDIVSVEIGLEREKYSKLITLSIMLAGLEYSCLE